MQDGRAGGCTPSGPFLFLAPITHGGPAPRPSRERRTRARRRGHRRGARSPASHPSRPWSWPFQPPHACVARAGGPTALWRSGRRCWSVPAESECARTPAGPPPTPAAWGPNPARSCLLSLTHPTATTPNTMASDEEAIKLHAAGLGAEGASEFGRLSGATGQPAAAGVRGREGGEVRRPSGRGNCRRRRRTPARPRPSLPTSLAPLQGSGALIEPCSAGSRTHRRRLGGWQGGEREGGRGSARQSLPPPLSRTPALLHPSPFPSQPPPPACRM